MLNDADLRARVAAVKNAGFAGKAAAAESALDDVVEWVIADRRKLEALEQRLVDFEVETGGMENGKR